ncbi:MAG: gamma-glutamyl-gamma-aminobutyrate hydrolase family protein, partial [Oscillospiraceae bacterium]
VQDIDILKNGNHMFAQQPMQTATHMVTTAKGSIIQEIIGSLARVNSYHHQCIKETGEGVEITATSKNGVPEAIEIPSRKEFTLGVQWHPEGLAAQDSQQLSVFKTFINSINVK